jgi:hypothetical protein
VGKFCRVGAVWCVVEITGQSKHRGRVYRLELCAVLSALLAAATGLRCVDDAGGDELNHACDELDSRLRECGLVTGGRFLCDDETWLSARRGERDEIACQYRCYAGAACAAAKDWACGLFVSGLPPSAMASDLLPLSECVSECATQYGLECAAADGEARPVSSTTSCDGTNDCLDGADELDCGSFACGNGQVVDQSVVCDGFFNCDNRRDERANCPFFTCGEGSALPFEIVCDGVESCPDGSDEEGCRDRSEFFMLDCTCGSPISSPCSEL